MIVAPLPPTRPTGTGSGWAPPADPTLYAYHSGPTTQFTDLVTSSLQGVGDSADSFDADFAAFIGILPPDGQGTLDIDDAINDFEAALADFSTDDFSPILADLENIGGGLDAGMAAISFLDDFGAVALGGLMPWLNSLADDLAGALGTLTDIGATITGLIENFGNFVTSYNTLYELVLWIYSFVSLGGWSGGDNDGGD